MDRGSYHCTGHNDQDHPQEKDMQKGQMVVWGGLTNSWGKKRNERQRRKGKIFPFECRVPKKSLREIRKHPPVINVKKIEENRMGKTRSLFKKIRDTKGTFHADMGSIKDRNRRDLTAAEDIKRRWQE